MRYSAFLVVLCALLLACSGAKPVSEAAPVIHDGEAQNAPQASDQRARIMRLFMDATKARLSGHLPEAAKLFEECVKVDPKNHAAIFELAKIYHVQQQPEEASSLAKKARDLDPENVWYRFLLADLFGQHGKGDEAVKVYRGILEKWPDRHEVRFQLAHTLAVSGKTEDARKVFDDIRRVLGSGEEVVMQEYGMLVNAGELEEARSLLQDALKDEPDNVAYSGMLAELYDELGQHDKALELYMAILKKDPGNSMVRVALAEHHYAKNDLALAFEQLEMAFADPDLDVDAKMQVLLGFFEMTTEEGQGDMDQQTMLQRAYRLIDVIEKAHPESGKPQTIRGDFLLRDGKFTEARDAFRQALRFEQDKYPIWMQLLQLDLQLGDNAALRKDAKAAAELFPSSPEMYLYEGLAASRLNDTEGAIEALVTGRDLVVDNPALLAQFWSTLGDVYNDSKRFDESDQAFDKAIELDPSNPTTLNNYAYYLSERGAKLDKAAKMSARSNELAPGQPSFQDTYAWVLYKGGKFNEALEWIEKAVASGGGQEGVIVEHHGDILYALGDADGALQKWRSAQQLGGAGEDIDRKVSDGRPPQ